MKKKIQKLVFAVACVAILGASSLTNVGVTPVFASDNSIERTSNGTNITVVVPTQKEQPLATPKPTPVVPILYPVGVSEKHEYNRREIIRVYELTDAENPDHIPREPFEREGYYYELSEIVKSEMLSFDSREHVEAITVSTANKDLETVLKLLAQTIEHHSEDGYVGNLTLDVSTIKTESAGTKTNTSTASRTREYPHLSSNDLSLVPKTISDGGKTFTLENVDWKTASTENVNYTEIPQTYTAIAVYSTKVSSTSITGYNTKAEYKGVISKTAQGKMRYTATYIGIPIVLPTLDKSTEVPNFETEMAEIAEIENNENIPDIQEETNISENVGAKSESELTNIKESATTESETKEIKTTESETETIETKEEQENEKQSGGISSILLIILLVAVAVIAYFAGKFGKKFINKMKKPLCLVLVGVSLFQIPLAVYASSLSSLPSYGFGSANAENTAYFETNSNSSETETTYHMETNANVSQLGFTDGQLIGKLTVAKLNKTINVYEGESLSSMNKGGGRFSFTGANTGNTAIIGHNRGRLNGYFIFVKDLKEGDMVSLEMGGVTQKYALSHLYTISETDLTPLGQFGDTRLTLVTCVEGVPNQRRIAVLNEVNS